MSNSHMAMLFCSSWGCLRRTGKTAAVSQKGFPFETNQFKKDPKADKAVVHSSARSSIISEPGGIGMPRQSRSIHAHASAAARAKTVPLAGFYGCVYVYFGGSVPSVWFSKRDQTENLHFWGSPCLDTYPNGGASGIDSQALDLFWRDETER